MFPRNPRERGLPSFFARRILATTLSRSSSTSWSQPCSYLVSRALGLISATTPIAPAITAALAWAPLMPPRPLVTKTFPARPSSPVFRYFLPAFRRVMVVPWTIPWGPMYMKLPAVIWP